MPRPRLLDWLVLGCLVIAWGSAFGALKIAVEDITPVWNTAARLWVASATLAVVCFLGRQRLPALKDPVWRYYAAIGVVGLAMPFFLFATAAITLPSAVNAICNGAMPIFTAVLAHLLLADRLTARRIAGVGLGFAGLVVLVGPRLVAGASVEGLALGAAIGGAAGFAISNIITRKAPPIPSSVGALMMCLAGAAVATGAAFAVEAPPTSMPAWPSVAAVVALGVFPTGLAGVGYVFLIKRQGPMFMASAVYLAPLWATALGVVLLAERPGWPAYAALAMILGGVALSTTHGPTRQPPRPRPS